MIPDGIIGQDFLLANVKKIDYEDFVMETVNDRIQCLMGNSNDKCQVCRIMVDDAINIPAQSAA
jgi:hypothetical protein